LHYFRTKDFIREDLYKYIGSNKSQCKQKDKWIEKEGVRGNYITTVEANNVTLLKSALNQSPVIAAMRGDWENF
jgi:hypothetical protein